MNIPATKKSGPALAALPKTSRRKFLAVVVALGASSLVRGSAGLLPAPENHPGSGSSWSADDRQAANGSLNDYYHPDTGSALSHKGFMDWNLRALEMM